MASLQPRQDLNLGLNLLETLVGNLWELEKTQSKPLRGCVGKLRHRDGQGSASAPGVLGKLVPS